jgi:hypothetical protein
MSLKSSAPSALVALSKKRSLLFGEPFIPDGATDIIVPLKDLKVSLFNSLGFFERLKVCYRAYLLASHFCPNKLFLSMWPSFSNGWFLFKVLS